MSVSCHVCSSDNREGARCCTVCGADLASICPQCQGRNKLAARFCVQCGAGLQPPAQPEEPAPAPIPLPPAPTLPPAPLEVTVPAPAPAAIPGSASVAAPIPVPDPAPAPPTALPGAAPSISASAPSNTGPDARSPVSARPLKPLLFEFDEAPASGRAATHSAPLLYFGAAAVLVLIGLAVWYFVLRPGPQNAAPAPAAAASMPAAVSAAMPAASGPASPAQAMPVAAQASPPPMPAASQVLQTTPAAPPSRAHPGQPTDLGGRATAAGAGGPAGKTQACGRPAGCCPARSAAAAVAARAALCGAKAAAVALRLVAMRGHGQ
ncbi:zinc ribbon domain-containing protein [Melaminivora sp.]